MRDFSSIMKEYVSSIKENMDTIEPVSRVYADVNANKDRSYWDYRNYKIKYHDNSRYKVEEQIGRGHFGTVFQAYDRSTGDDVAVKILNKKTYHKKSHRKTLKREILILKAVYGGPNIIKLHDLIRDPDTDQPAMVFELARNVRLRKILQDLSLSQVQFYFYELLKALDYCHSNGIMHRDVKPGNIMFDPDNKVLKLVDWGLAEFYHPGEPYSLYGTTRPYKAPEQLVGVMVASVVFMSKPFFRQNKDELFKEKNKHVETDFEQLTCIASIMGTKKLHAYIKKYELDNERTDDINLYLPKFSRVHWEDCVKPKKNKFVTKNSLHLVDKLLRYDQATRLTAKEAMKHPFFTDPE